MREISGDTPLAVRDKILYLCLNLARGLKGQFCGHRVEYLYFKNTGNDKDSPARKYSKEFLAQELYKIMPSDNVRFLDVGCGRGDVRAILAGLPVKCSYTGVDIAEHDDFHSMDPYVLDSIFIRSNIEDYSADDKFDIVYSHSFLEHVANDAWAVSKCSSFTKPGTGRQIHIIPSFWALFLYLWHGYRQYTPVRIKALFGNKEYKVYRIGGLFSFLLHFFFITLPNFFFRTDKMRDLKVYQRSLKFSNRLDRFFPVCSCFYIVVV